MVICSLAYPTMPKLTPIWAKMAQESTKAYSAFELYRNLGPGRTCGQVAAKLGRCEKHMQKWSTKYKWVARCQAWDEEVSRLQVERFHKKRTAAIDEQANLGEVLRNKALEGALNLDTEKMDPHQIARLAETGVKIERLAYGDSTKNENTNQTIQFVVGELPPWAKAAVAEPPKSIPADPQERSLTLKTRQMLETVN